MINIMFCGNDKVFDGALTCALSIMKRSKLTEPLKFYLLTMDVSHIKPEYLPISAEQTAFFEEVVKKYNPEIAAHDSVVLPICPVDFNFEKYNGIEYIFAYTAALLRETEKQV